MRKLICVLIVLALVSPAIAAKGGNGKGKGGGSNPPPSGGGGIVIHPPNHPVALDVDGDVSPSGISVPPPNYTADQNLEMLLDTQALFDGTHVMGWANAPAANIDFSLDPSLADYRIVVSGGSYPDAGGISIIGAYISPTAYAQSFARSYVNQSHLGVPQTVAYLNAHEFGHALGFQHSTDPNNIMYGASIGTMWAAAQWSYILSIVGIDPSWTSPAMTLTRTPIQLSGEIILPGVLVDTPTPEPSSIVGGLFVLMLSRVRRRRV